MEEKNDVPILNIMDPGNLPIEKCRPARLTSTIVAFLLGLVAGIAWNFRIWILSQFREGRISQVNNSEEGL
jgi:capsular polysaccharide biosynthesis protein